MLPCGSAGCPCQNSNIAMDKTDNIKRDKDLTIEEVSACEEYKNLSDEQAQRLIETLKIYTQVVYEFFQKKSEIEKNENVKIIPIHSYNFKNKAA